MTLSIGLDAALSGLSATAEQTAVVSRNIARAGDPHASRKTANLVTLPGGGVELASITRATNDALFDKMLGADLRCRRAAGDRRCAEPARPDDQRSRARRLAGRAGRQARRRPAALCGGSAGRRRSPARPWLPPAISPARSTSATQTVQQVRSQADADMAACRRPASTRCSPSSRRSTARSSAARAGADVTDYLDQRDQILASISEEVGVRTVTRADNDMAIYTDSGVTLFDTARAPSPSIARCSSLPARPATPSTSTACRSPARTGPMLPRSGRLAGPRRRARQRRRHLSEPARRDRARADRGLRRERPERGADAAGRARPLHLSRRAGHAAPAAPCSPASPASIRVNANVDPAQGGNPSRLRDGGIVRQSGLRLQRDRRAAAYSDRLQQLLDGLDTQQAFDPAAQAAPSATVAELRLVLGRLAAGGAQDRASDDADYKTTLLERSLRALSKATGVNLDEEMTLLLELERSYQASTRLITTIDNMLGALLQAVG